MMKHRHQKTVTGNTAMIAGAAACACMLIQMQVYAQQDAGTTLKSVLASTQGAEDQKIRIGSYVFHPDITVAQYIDDNVYSTTSAEQDDTVSSLYADFDFDSDWKKHLLDIKLGFDASRYTTYTSENTVDNWISLKGEYDISKTITAKISAGYFRDHEDRASPDAIFGIEPTEIQENRYTAGFEKEFGLHSLTIAASSINQDYHDVDTAAGIISNDTRDMTRQSLGIRFNYAVSSKYFVYAKSSHENRDYDEEPDLNLFNRDSSIDNHVAGFKFNYDNSLYGEIYGGRLKQSFDDTRFSQISKPDYGANINWHPTDSSKIIFISDRSFEETTLDNTPGFLYDQHYIKFIHGLAQHWSYYLNAVQASADYQLITRKDDYSDYAIGANYHMLRGLTFGMDIVHLERDSIVDTDDYSRNQVYIRVSAQL